LRNSKLPSSNHDSSPAAAADKLDPPSSSHRPSHHVSIKVAPPDPFSGNLAKTEEFITSLMLYFVSKGEDLTDGQRMTFALSYMKGGTAGQWAKRKVKQLQKEGQNWDEFLADFQASFSDPDPAGTARHKIDLLRQGSNSADEYVASFRELMDDTGFNDAALVDKFEKGLDGHLWKTIRSLPVVPDTLDDWVSEALKHDRQQRMLKQRAKFMMPSFQGSTTRHSSSNPSHNSTPTPRQAAPPPPVRSQASPPSSSDVVPMEVDSGWKRIGQKVCYKCRKPGHFARDCKSKLDINALDYDGLKGHFQKEIEQEAQAKEAQDFQ